MEWQPIETMPIGVNCLVFHGLRGEIAVSYRPQDMPDRLYPGGASYAAWATHWMPLPEAPK